MKPDPEHGYAQYDYAYNNSELLTDDEKKIKILQEVKNVVGYTATKVAEAGMRLGGQTHIPEFNSNLNMHNGFDNTNPLGNPRPTMSNKGVIKPARVNPVGYRTIIRR